jgi:hypothetical protein
MILRLTQEKFHLTRTRMPRVMGRTAGWTAVVVATIIMITIMAAIRAGITVATTTREANIRMMTIISTRGADITIAAVIMVVVVVVVAAARVAAVGSRDNDRGGAGHKQHSWRTVLSKG